MLKKRNLTDELGVNASSSDKTECEITPVAAAKLFRNCVGMASVP